MIVLALLSLFSLASMPIFWLCIVLFILGTSGPELESMGEAILSLWNLVSAPPNWLDCSLMHITNCEPLQLQGECESPYMRLGSFGLTSTHPCTAQNNPSCEGIVDEC